MESDFNPYQPPRAAVEQLSHAAENCWSDGKRLIMRVGSALPQRCVKCNEPAILPLKSRKVYWHHPGWYALILISILIYIIAALIVRKKADIAPGLCARHQRKRRIALSIGWTGFLLSLFMLFASFSTQNSGYVWSYFLVFAVSIIWIVVGARILYPVRITKEEIHLKGCGEAFLSTLPQRYF